MSGTRFKTSCRAEKRTGERGAGVGPRQHAGRGEASVIDPVNLDFIVSEPTLKMPQRRVRRMGLCRRRGARGFLQQRGVAKVVTLLYQILSP